MIFPKKCLGCPPFLGYICWPKVVGAFLLLPAPLLYFLSGVPGFLIKNWYAVLRALSPECLENYLSQFSYCACVQTIVAMPVMQLW